MNSNFRSAALVAAAALLVVPHAAAAAADQDVAQAAFYRAAYLQNEKRDYAAAAELFAQAAEADGADAELVRNAELRLRECQEDLVAQDLAGLMPPDSLVYVQLANIGDQAMRVLEQTGLVGAPGAGRFDPARRIPIENGLSMPIDFRLSPALVRELGKAGGVAAALVGVGERGVPDGLIVAHLGDSDLLRGLIETGVQIIDPQEPIGGYATYRIPADGVSIWMVRTARLLLVSPSRERIASAVQRLQAPDSATSLRDETSFRDLSEDRSDSLLFAWANAQRAAPLVDRLLRDELRDEELLIAQTVLNLRQVQCAAFSAGAGASGLQAEAVVRFTPEHQHLLYGLIRTAPIAAESWSLVPAEAAAVVSLGLNPPHTQVDATGATATPGGVALMDFGRELFGNLESATLFLVPGKAPLPEVALALKACDPDKSQRLWTQLLGLPAQLGVMPPKSAGETTMRGRKANTYQFPEAPPIAVVATDEGALLCGTPGAVDASLAAIDANETVADHAHLGAMIEQASAATSKAVYVSVGGVMQCARPMVSDHDRREMDAIAPLLQNTVAGLTIDEAPTEFRVRLEIAGLPQMANVLEAVDREQRRKGARRTAAAEVKRWDAK